MPSLTPSIATLALLLAGCAPTASSGIAGPAPVLVRVDNRGWSEVRVYARRGLGAHVPLGDVRAVAVATFRLPARLAGDEPVSFEADPVGGSAVPLGDAIIVRPGQRVMLTLEQDLAMSSVGVRE